jgi:type I restriction enzyme S subunit
MSEQKTLLPKLRFPEFRQICEWIPKRLKDTCEVNPASSALPERFVYIDLESVEAGKLVSRKIITRGEAPSRAQRLLHPDDVIFQIVRPYQRNNYHFKASDDLDYVASTGYAQLRAKDSADFLFQAVHVDGFVDRVIAKCTGSSYPAINSSDLAEIPLAIPKPNEQQKIAVCLSSLDELIAAQARKVDALKTHKKGLMQQLFPREGETQPRLRFPEFRDVGAWKEVALGQLMTIKGRIGYRGYTVEDIVEAGEGAISLSPSNISAAGMLSFEKATYISWAKFYESPEIILENNFTVLVKTGSTYGKVAFIRDLPHACTVNPQIVVLKPTSTNPYFLYLLISGEPIQSRIEATVVGGAIPTLSQESISKFVVCVPSEAEQQRIADCLTSLDTLITTATQELETLKTHKKGLMQQLFPSAEAVDA